MEKYLTTLGKTMEFMIIKIRIGKSRDIKRAWQNEKITGFNRFNCLFIIISLYLFTSLCFSVPIKFTKL